MEKEPIKPYALVTGGSRGIGRAICLELAEQGYNILIGFNSQQPAAQQTLELVTEKNVLAELLQFDVTDTAGLQTILEGWIASHPDCTIEVLINNAGIRKDNLLMWMKDEDWHHVLNTNLNAVFFITRLVSQQMIAKRYGRIINIVSLSGIKGLPGQTNYSAAKAGVIGFTKALAQELGRRKITVNAVAPGFIRTDMTADIPEKEYTSLIPMARFGEADEVAAAVGFLASRSASYITGEVLSVNGGLYT